jgi:CRP-like cAMP-binding protein
MELASSFDKLKDLTSRFNPLPEKEWHDFSAIWTPLTAKRKEVLTRPGEKERFIYFITDGIQRVYYDDEQHEATLVFTYAPSFGGVLDSLMQQQPSRYCYETLSPSAFLRATASDLFQLMARYPAIETMVRKGLSYTLSGLMERMVELQSYTAEERFRTLLQRSPHILQLVPHKYLANYLGMDATNFSKLMNAIRI